MEELKEHIKELYGLLSVEIDLNGSRTHMAYNLRIAIINAENELEALTKTVHENCTCINCENGKGECLAAFCSVCLNELDSAGKCGDCCD